MKTNNFISALAAICILGFISSCKPTDDTKPVFTVSEPLSGTVFQTGNEIHFEAGFSDDKELSQYKIDIHNNFDGHGHGKTEGLPAWETTIINDLNGKNENVHIHIDIPNDIAAGEYHFIVSCIDKAGNEAEPQEIEIFIQNSSDLVAPQLTLNTPADNAAFNAGDNIVISGMTTDNIALEKVEIVIERHANGTKVYDNDIDVSGISYDINETVNTAGWQSGEYHLTVKVFDGVNNSTTVERYININ